MSVDVKELARTSGPRQPEAIALFSLDLHPIFRNNKDIELALREFIFKAAATGVPVAEVIPGKGSGQLKKRVLAFLAQKHIKKLYTRLEADPTNAGRILVYFR
ncbi:Smr/MutS family protein [Streptomyces sp. NPDC048473]|uniref:Smr/MutS family protein n=1 Tax=unclassified Streptomyces TaxID=2593676 RepID=UPI003714DA6F